MIILPEFEFYEESVRNDELRHLEKQFAPLPPKFGEFIRVYNGGVPIHRKIWRDDEDSLYISMFFPIGAEYSNNMIAERSAFPREMNVSLIPIAQEGSGHYLILDLLSDRILLFDSDSDYPELVCADDLKLLARNVEVFLSELSEN